MEFFPKAVEGVLPDSTLLVATVSIGNVGQLACEQLLAQTKHQLVGYLHDPNVLPCFGHDPFRQRRASPAVSLELYRLEDTPLNVYVLQQRAPAQIGRQTAFAENMVSWMLKCQFKRVIISGSVEADARQDAQIKDRRCWYLHACQPHVAELDQLGLQPLTNELEVRYRIRCGNRVRTLIVQDLKSRVLPPWSLLSECSKREIDAVAVLSFSEEGDNLQDGVEQARALRSLLSLSQTPVPVTMQLSGE